ncbi:MAG: hypothetical protein JSV80_14960 [Acidobacteriota bacterium]|nr:MAG: hypothetical protein JSV80_14960 [Acidobacteriota bacterium]
MRVVLDSRFRTWLPRLVLVAVVGTFAVLAWLRFWYNDDVFITFRYARHLADGHGLVWNVDDGDPVEGTTSLGWCALIAAAMRAGLDPLVASHYLGLVSGIAGLVLVYLAGRRLLGLSPWMALVAPALLAAHRQWVLWSVSGLETQTATVLAFAATLQMAREQEAHRSGWLASGLMFFLATLFRPETPLLHLAAGIGIVLSLGSLASVRRVVLSGVVHGALVGLLTVWRLSYFGQPLPNTFYAKVGALQPDTGLVYLGQFLLQTHGYLWLPVLVVGCLLVTRGAPVLWSMAGLQLACWIVWIVLFGGGRWEFRFLEPVLPDLALMLAFSLIVFDQESWLGRALGTRLALVCPAIVSVLLIVSQAATSFVSFRTFDEVYSVQILTRAATNTLREGALLSAYLTRSDRIATGWAGAIPFMTGAWHFDTWGLNDSEIARRPFDTTSPLFHQRHATWQDIVKREVMFCDAFNQFVYPRPYPPQQLPRIRRVPWTEPGVPIYCLRLRPDAFWIFASPRPREEIESWARNKGLTLQYVIPLPASIPPLFGDGS